MSRQVGETVPVRRRGPARHVAAGSAGSTAGRTPIAQQTEPGSYLPRAFRVLRAFAFWIASTSWSLVIRLRPPISSFFA